MLHTRQHFDANMSDVFFNQLNIPRPDIQFDIHGGNHGEMTGRVLIEIEQALLEHKPDRVLVYGDTNPCRRIGSGKATYTGCPRGGRLAKLQHADA